MMAPMAMPWPMEVPSGFDPVQRDMSSALQAAAAATTGGFAPRVFKR